VTLTHLVNFVSIKKYFKIRINRNYISKNNLKHYLFILNCFDNVSHLIPKNGEEEGHVIRELFDIVFGEWF